MHLHQLPLDFSDPYLLSLVQSFDVLVDKNDTGEEVSRLARFPYQASLRRAPPPHEVVCSASVIHPLLLITTAGCTRYFRAGDIAVPGDYKRSTLDGTEQERTVEEIIVHEDHNPRTYDNDIALVVLHEPLRFDNYTKPVHILRPELSRKRKLPTDYKYCSSYETPLTELIILLSQ